MDDLAVQRNDRTLLLKMMKS